jgi:hypothetical protein
LQQRARKQGQRRSCGFRENGGLGCAGSAASGGRSSAASCSAWPKLGLHRRFRPTVARRHRKFQHLGDGPRIDPKPSRNRPPA